MNPPLADEPIFPSAMRAIRSCGDDVESGNGRTAQRLRGCGLLCRTFAAAISALCLLAGGAPGLVAEAAASLTPQQAGSRTLLQAAPLYTIAALAMIVAVTAGWRYGGSRAVRRSPRCGGDRRCGCSSGAGSGSCSGSCSGFDSGSEGGSGCGSTFRSPSEFASDYASASAPVPCSSHRAHPDRV